MLFATVEREPAAALVRRTQGKPCVGIYPNTKLTARILTEKRDVRDATARVDVRVALKVPVDRHLVNTGPQMGPDRLQERTRPERDRLDALGREPRILGVTGDVG